MNTTLPVSRITPGMVIYCGTVVHNWVPCNKAAHGMTTSQRMVEVRTAGGQMIKKIMNKNTRLSVIVP